MNGTVKTLSNTGCPWPGGDAVSFQQADVIALGKLQCWGSACIQFLVRLADGRELFVRADKQPKEDERFLRKIARKVPRLGGTSLREGWRTTWIELAPGSGGASVVGVHTSTSEVIATMSSHDKLP